LSDLANKNTGYLVKFEFLIILRNISKNMVHAIYGRRHLMGRGVQ
jgi:hypothetical protein